ncbi:hypothetical protein QQZ08_010282 [Neonectria magnoliae]|uniref:Uncharacterized protein n=1 Tax=Neonectria magnoliae TaxID=2732573 RepID=A0ABR1HHY4_9HYPO
MGGHHCGGCHKVLTTRCVSKKHMVPCPIHFEYHIPGKPCVSCHDAQERAERQKRIQAREQKQEPKQKPSKKKK